MKRIFVTGGVVSGLGKGITAASLGRLLKQRGFRVISQKLDPYINVDPGTMSPYQHGEVFVTDDGAETDLDLGHYERFIDENLNKFSNLTSGKAYWNVLCKERRGEYLGETVQIIPHITNEIKRFIYNVGEHANADIVITEIGGTVGDIESQPFLEAIRQISIEHPEDCCFIHVTLVPYISGSNEYKSKPTQHSVKELQNMGVRPNIIIPRCDGKLPQSVKEKISLFCNVKADCVIENTTVADLYEAPVMLEEQNFSAIVCRELHLEAGSIDLSEWNTMLERIYSAKDDVNIALEDGFKNFDHKIPGFLSKGIMTGMESRSSSPIRITREEDGQSISCKGIYPCGEGAGYAGGIVSSAVDGIRQAENVLAHIRETEK